MPKKILAKFEVTFLQVMDETGKVDSKLMPKLKTSEIKQLYELVILSKTFDDYALKLQREGRLGTFASGRGQEAAHVGSAFALKKEDWMFPAFRENAAYITKGMPMEMLYAYWGGDERGEMIPEGINCFTVSIPVGSQILHAVGHAWATKIKKEKTVTVTYFGDGATSEGDFHEAMNFAGVFKVPCVFLCMNNNYAISLPREKQTASQTLAQKAIAYGFEGIQVDGNDIFAVYKATKDAIEKAPTLIELLTYRLEHHTTADDSTKYRNTKEVKEWSKKDPILRLESYMKKKKLLVDEYKNQVQENSEKKVEEAIKKYTTIPTARTNEIFQYTFKDMTWNLKEQLKELKENYGERLE